MAYDGAYLDDLSREQTGDPFKKKTPKWNTMPGYKAEGVTNSGASMPSVNQQKTASPQANSSGLRYYKDPSSGQVVSTYDDTLPSGGTWVRWQGGGDEPGSWIDIQPGEANYIKPETREEKRIRELKEANQAYAKEFREKLPETERRLLGDLGKQASGSLYQGQQAIRQGASARGALYGGGRIGQEQSLRSGIGSQMAGAAQKIRSGLIGKAKQLEDQAVQSGIDIQQQQQQINDSIYAQAMSEYQSEMSAWGSLLQAGGTIAAISMMGPAAAAIP